MTALKAYITGFVLSVLLTLAAYIPVSIDVHSGYRDFSQTGLIVYVLLLAFTQLIVQLLMFLHLGSERRPRWNLVVFACAVSLIVIVVGGSIWIMNHLNYNMTPQQIQDYISNSDGL